MFWQLLTDVAFGYPWDRQAKINSQYAPTYTFVVAFRSLNASEDTEWMGAFFLINGRDFYPEQTN